MSTEIAPIASCQKIGQAAWRKLEVPDFPFADYEFWEALELSGSIGGKSGWEPFHLLLGSPENPEALLLNFVKHHSYGEYIFDWEWARFYQRYGRAYYPKFLTALPFTPATGPRILLADHAATDAREILVAAQKAIGDRENLSSSHALFITPEEIPAYETSGYAIRHSLQYHWENKGFAEFQDYLDAFVGKRRRDIVRERRNAHGHGLHLECISGSALNATHADAMYRLYRDTTQRKGAIPYLTEDFFQRIFRTMPDRIVLSAASSSEGIQAAALNFRKGKKLFGRYWGSFGEYRDLHFELCYYQPIAYAIQEKLELFEAGAQGEHKLQRGFLPARTLSAHWIREDAFREAIFHYIEDEKNSISQAREELSLKGPYRANESDTRP